MTRKLSAYARKRRAQGTEQVLPITMRFSQAIEMNLQLIPHDCLANFKQGRQTEADWHALAARCNLGSTLARDQFAESTDVMNASIEALKSVWDRFQRLGRMGMTGEEYNAIAVALELTDDMQKLSTRRELDSALTTVLREAAVLDRQQETSENEA